VAAGVARWVRGEEYGIETLVVDDGHNVSDEEVQTPFFEGRSLKGDTVDLGLYANCHRPMSRTLPQVDFFVVTFPQ